MSSRNAREGWERHSEVLPEAADPIPLKDLAGYVAIRDGDDLEPGDEGCQRIP